MKRITILFAFSAIAAGCAVTPGPNGRANYQLDEGAIFGRVVDEFTLADGSRGTIRVASGKYSVKLDKYSKVIQAPNATALRLVDYHHFGDRTILVMNKREPGCALKTVVANIRGPQITRWDIGDCRQAPDIQFDDYHLALDYKNGADTIRYQMVGDQMQQSVIPAPRPAMPVVQNPAPTPSATTPAPTANASKLVTHPDAANAAVDKNNDAGATAAVDTQAQKPSPPPKPLTRPKTAPTAIAAPPKDSWSQESLAPVKINLSE